MLSSYAVKMHQLGCDRSLNEAGEGGGGSVKCSLFISHIGKVENSDGSGNFKTIEMGLENAVDSVMTVDKHKLIPYHAEKRYLD